MSKPAVPPDIPEPDFVEPVYGGFDISAPPPDIPEPSGDVSIKPISSRNGRNDGIKPDRADEGEFWHLQAKSEAGLELLGNISRILRKADGADCARARRLLARGVAVREREEYIAFVTPDDTFLSMSEPHILAVFNGVLDKLGIKKRAKIELTEDDLYAQDFMRAVLLFGRDGAVPKE